MQSGLAGKFVLPGHIAEHEELITENDQDSFSRDKTCPDKTPFEGNDTPAKRADLDSQMDASSRSQAPVEGVAHARGEDHRASRLRAQEYNLERDGGPRWLSTASAPGDNSDSGHGG